MSFEAKVKIGSTEFRLLHCTYGLNREVDATGRPSSGNRGGTLYFEIETTEDITLWSWMVDPYKTQDGTITFNKRDSNTKMKEVKWTKGYITQINETFDPQGIGHPLDKPKTPQKELSRAELLHLEQVAQSRNRVTGDGNPATMKFAVSAETIDIAGAKHVNPWPKS